MYQYEVRFTSVEDGEDFAEWYLANIYWINESDEYNRAFSPVKITSTAH